MSLSQKLYHSVENISNEMQNIFICIPGIFLNDLFQNLCNISKTGLDIVMIELILGKY